MNLDLARERLMGEGAESQSPGILWRCEMGKVLQFRRPTAVQQRPRVSAVEELMAAQMRFVWAWAGLVNPMWWACGPMATAHRGSQGDRPQDQAIPIRSSLRRV